MNIPIKLTASGIAYTGPCELNVFLLGCDGVNDVTDFTIFDGTSATGKEIVPTADYEADYKGLNGAAELHLACWSGVVS